MRGRGGGVRTPNTHLHAWNNFRAAASVQSCSLSENENAFFQQEIFQGLISP